ncbi:MAG TPA: hypothetical protein VK053_19585 [Jiangellaceae bacterium]|nr:hypothetical protein [Jiangellaceae bacterium]
MNTHMKVHTSTGVHMGSLTGTGTMAWLVLRRKRISLTAWVVILVGLMGAGISGMESLYPTQSDREAYAATTQASAAPQALNGPATAVDTAGGMVVFELGWYLAIAVAVLNISLVASTVRGDEEAGRTELLRAGILGRHAPLTATLLVAGTVDVVIGAGVTAVMAVSGLPVTGALAYGLALAAIGIAFAGVTAVAAQVTEHTRGVVGLAAAALGVAYVLRAVGDVGSGTVSWLSPLGWVQAIEPFGSNRWWPGAMAVGVAVLLTGLAMVLAGRRDVGAGLVPPRPGPAKASAALAGPGGLSWRLSRWGLLGWVLAMLAAGIAFGSVADDMTDVVAGSDALVDFIGGSGESLVDAYFVLVALLLGLAITGFVISGVLRLRTEETAGRAEPILATVVSRWRWAGTHLAVVAAGSVAVAVAGGLGMALGHGLRTGEFGPTGELIGASAGHLPAAWVIGGVTGLAVGVVPRVSALAWALLGGAVIVSLLGQPLQLPSWTLDLSPLEHSPELPGGSVDAGTIAILVALGVATLAVGLVGLRRRDIA